MSAEQSTVEYRKIPGHPFYCAGTDGSIWSKRTGVWHRLKPQLDKRRGYLHVFLGAGISRQVHRLILEAFVGPCPPKHQGRHFPDRNPANNRLENLQWGTPKENYADAVAHGTASKGERQSQAKLTDEMVRQIRAEYKKCKPGKPIKPGSTRALAEKYGVTQNAIRRVIAGTGWKHVI